MEQPSVQLVQGYLGRDAGVMFAEGIDQHYANPRRRLLVGLCSRIMDAILQEILDTEVITHYNAVIRLYLRSSSMHTCLSGHKTLSSSSDVPSRR